MLENVNYKIDLYYGDIGFTSDYANVLQFERADVRDRYFDNISEKDTVNNTDFNNIQLSGNTVKIAFTDSNELTRLEKYNYIRILTRLYGTSSYSDKYDYGFIVDYSIISSSSNVTVVEFRFETDLWQNYQFDFKLKECSVERSHMDRWNKDDNKLKYTRPSMELLDSFMQKFKEPQKIIKTGRCYNTNGELEENVPFAIALITVTQVRALDPVDPSRMANGVFFRYFPVRLDKPERIMAIKPVREGFATDYFLSISELFMGNITDYFVLNANAIVNVQLLFNTSLDMDVDDIHSATYYHYTVIKGNKTEIPMNLGEYNNTRFATCYDSALEEPINGYKEVISVDITRPVKPHDGADYSINYEPMMFKAPVFKRYFTNYLTDTIYEVPDTILNIDSEISITTVFGASSSYNILKMIDDEYPVQALASLSSIFVALDCDVLNDYWKQYVMQNRDADRQLMWANILTGGIAESGSTAVSAGIGYRSNMERAELADMSNISPITAHEQNTMYKKYAKQAMGFSVLGGITAMSANAIGNYARQVSTEQAIKNKPSNLIIKGNAYNVYELSNSNLVYSELRCDDKSYEQYANNFKKFGYFIGGVIEPDINSRKYFNYIKTNGAILTGSLNQSILAKLCRIFDNGVTIWHMDYASGHLYEYDKENIERTLIGE